MAKDNDKPAATKPAKDEAPRFEVRTPNAGFRGERWGVTFRDGAARTDSEEVAQAFVDQGYQVTDTKTGKCLSPAAAAKKDDEAK